jgi:hypothetical protein
MVIPFVDQIYMQYISVLYVSGSVNTTASLIGQSRRLVGFDSHNFGNGFIQP